MQKTNHANLENGQGKSATGRSPIAIAVHGGAGAMKTGSMTWAQEAEFFKVLESALRSGYALLQDGGMSTDAVTAAVKVLEDSPLFNAGRGAVYTAEGDHELDAAIMDGSQRRAGAVAGVTRIRNPVELAKIVMERSPHVLLLGSGAELFAREQGMELVDNHYFDTAEKLENLKKARKRELAVQRGDSIEPMTEEEKHGTVGCVALDSLGNLAAATSTGGMTNKHPGRVGDSPIIGAGTFADNDTCAVSATGHGEYFLRWVVAHEVASQIRYNRASLQAAANDVIHRQLHEAGGTGGLIAMDLSGAIAMPFNTDGMYRGYIDVEQRMLLAIYR